MYFAIIRIENSLVQLISLRYLQIILCYNLITAIIIVGLFHSGYLQ